MERALNLVGTLFYLKLFQLDPTLRARLEGAGRDAGAQIRGRHEAHRHLAQPRGRGWRPPLKLLGVRPSPAWDQGAPLPHPWREH